MELTTSRIINTGFLKIQTPIFIMVQSSWITAFKDVTKYRRKNVKFLLADMHMDFGKQHGRYVHSQKIRRHEYKFFLIQ